MKKRGRKKSIKRRKKLSLVPILTILAFLIITFDFYIYNLGYNSGYEEAKQHSTSTIKTKSKHQRLQDKVLSEIEDYKKSIKKLAKKIAAKEEKKPPPPNTSTKTVVSKTKKPELAIIIDDVAYGYQVRAIQKLHIPINISFFPPTKKHPNTPIYAKRLAHYMIHLPLQANNYPHPEANTLQVSSTHATIEQVIRRIRHSFPKARFVNNHTGSAFTANKEAMERLIQILDKYNFRFIDSRTTPLTKVAQVQKEFGHPYIARNIFLDNKQDISYIKNQLKKAVHIAQRRGFAIAIGHPHPATLKALAQSQGILKKVRLIYVDELLK